MDDCGRCIYIYITLSREYTRLSWPLNSSPSQLARQRVAKIRRNMRNRSHVLWLKDFKKSSIRMQTFKIRPSIPLCSPLQIRSEKGDPSDIISNRTIRSLLDPRGAKVHPGLQIPRFFRQVDRFDEANMLRQEVAAHHLCLARSSVFGQCAMQRPAWSHGMSPWDRCSQVAPPISGLI